MNTNTILTKLVEAEKAVAGLHDSMRRDDKEKRQAWEALNSVRAAIQGTRDMLGDPDVQRQTYSCEERAGQPTTTLIERHESYGVVTVTKPVGSMRLVGSMVDRLPSCIEVKVHRARREVDTHLHTEYYYADNYVPAVSLRLSVAQWAELISSMSGTQIPCTLTSLQGVKFDSVPEETKTPLELIAQHSRDESRKMVDGAELDYFKALDALEAKIIAAGISKKRTDELKELVVGLRRHVTAPRAAAEWASQRLAEDTEKTVAQGKVEMSAAFQGMIIRAGMEAIQGRLSAAIEPQLGGGEP